MFKTIEGKIVNTVHRFLVKELVLQVRCRRHNKWVEDLKKG
jgi:hypothetical protein